jgi:hypothetical protein
LVNIPSCQHDPPPLRVAVFWPIQVKRRHLARGGEPTTQPSRAPGAPSALSPNEKLNLAFIGVAGQGGANIVEITGAEDVNVVALCDVDENRLNGGGEKFPRQTLSDFRQPLKSRNPWTVVVSTPDHNHALASMMAIKLGRHVYCEKPLTRTVKEARAVTLAAREAKVATQMGNQGMAFEGNRFINEWLADGAIGAVCEVTFVGLAQRMARLFWWPQGIERPATPPRPPIRLGPMARSAADAAVSSDYVPFKWRGWWIGPAASRHGHPQLAPVFSALKLAPTVFTPARRRFSETIPLATSLLRILTRAVAASALALV